jgi:hypothetical protein
MVAASHPSLSGEGPGERSVSTMRFCGGFPTLGQRLHISHTADELLDIVVNVVIFQPEGEMFVLRGP